MGFVELIFWLGMADLAAHAAPTMAEQTIAAIAAPRPAVVRPISRQPEYVPSGDPDNPRALEGESPSEWISTPVGRLPAKQPNRYRG